MTPEAQRIAIAEACGFSRAPEYDDTINVEKVWKCNGRLVYESNLPDYLNDLNAMHEAEKTLDDVGQRKFSMSLHELTRAGETFGRGLNYWTVIHTTARERAEAFLRAIGKWEE